MKECAREPEIVSAVTSGRWPAACEAELVDHTTSCSICTEVLLVACALREDHDSALNEVKVPSAGLVWWRAELRARRHATLTAERSMTLVYAFAGACAVGVALALIGRMLPSFRELLSFENLAEAGYLPLVLAVAAIFVIAPVALYVVFSDD